MTGAALPQLVSERPRDDVPATRWSNEFLDRMRLVADPETDALARELFDLEGPPGLIRMTRALEDWEAPIPDSLPASMREPGSRGRVAYPAFVDPAQLYDGRTALREYGPISTAALLMCAVPHFFTNAAGARAFYLAKIFSPESLRNRMLEITQFVRSFTRYGGLAQFWLAPSQRDAAIWPDWRAQGTRRDDGAEAPDDPRRHPDRCSRIPKDPEHRWNPGRCGKPINQEDLCEAILCFCFCTIDALAKLGIDQSAKQEEATLCAWKTVGHLLGLSEELQPADVDEARALHKVVFERSCRETQESKVLIAELVHIMRGIVPGGARRRASGADAPPDGPPCRRPARCPEPPLLELGSPPHPLVLARPPGLRAPRTTPLAVDSRTGCRRGPPRGDTRCCPRRSRASSGRTERKLTRGEGTRALRPAARKLDLLKLMQTSQVFCAPPEAGQSGTALARRSLDGLRRSLARVWLAGARQPRRSRARSHRRRGPRRARGRRSASRAPP